MLFPTAEGDGSTLFTGRRFRRDVRAAAGWAEVCLTNRRLLVQLLSPKVLIVEIALPDVRAVGLADGGAAPDLREVVYADARVGGLTRLAAFTGAPAALPDRLLLSLGGETAGWLRDLRRALGDQGRRPSAPAEVALAAVGQTPNG